jgi:hypothetical protein
MSYLNVDNSSTTAQPTSFSAALGSQTAPSYAFVGDSNTGLFSSGADVVAITTGGTNRFNVSNTLINCTLKTQFANGSVANPSICSSSYTTTGLSWGSGTLSFSVNASTRAQVDTVGLKLFGSTAGNNTSYLPTALAYYEENNANLTAFYFADLTGSQGYKITRIGRIVSVHFSGTIAFGVPGYNDFLISSIIGIIPLRYRPASTVNCGYVEALDGTAYTPWSIEITSGGVVNFYRNPRTSSANAVTLQPASFSYTL